ncbi:Tetratricopeptide repeat protein 25 [Entophlyctis luteolus]|nr:Tetratricopeptide repeat protein 25 [Entophlyctis luteolus]
MKKPEQLSDDEVELDPKDIQGQYQAFHAEADKLASSGLYAEAIDRYNRALRLVPNQLDCLVNRARCFMLQGDTMSSLEDVNKVLELSPSFIRAIYQKAETLYTRGDFEDALVLFHRGAKARPELVGFEMGIHKCIEAIRSAVVLLDTEKMKKILKKNSSVDEKSVDSTDGLGKRGSAKDAARSTKRAVAGSGSKERSCTEYTVATLQMERNLIEELQDDKLFLLELLTDTRLCQSCNGDVEELVNEGLEYIETRVEFWRQGNPNAASAATVKAATMGSRLNLAQQELAKLKAKQRGGLRTCIAGIVGLGMGMVMGAGGGVGGGGGSEKAKERK